MKIACMLVCILSSISSNAFCNFEFINNKDQYFLHVNFLEKLQNVFQADIFFETGTNTGGTTMAAIPYFKELITTEIHKDLAIAAKNTFIPFSQVRVCEGDSAAFIKAIVPTLQGTILFWLDAHDSGGTDNKGSNFRSSDTFLTKEQAKDPDMVTAIRRELKAIHDVGIQDCVILIDDIRLFGAIISEEEYMGSWAYPSIQEIQTALLNINPNFELALLGDVLLAYDKNKYRVDLSEVVKACTKIRLYNGLNLTDLELLDLEKVIANASIKEKKFIKQLYWMTEEWKQPLFVYDLWYGLVSMGEGNYLEAYRIFSNVKARIQSINKYGDLDSLEVRYNHPRIQFYMQKCLLQMLEANNLQGNNL